MTSRGVPKEEVKEGAVRLRTVRSGNVGVAFTAKVRFLRGGTIDQSCPWLDWLGVLDDVDSGEKGVGTGSD